MTAPLSDQTISWIIREGTNLLRPENMYARLMSRSGELIAYVKRLDTDTQSWEMAVLHAQTYYLLPIEGMWELDNAVEFDLVPIVEAYDVAYIAIDCASEWAEGITEHVSYINDYPFREEPGWVPPKR